MSNKNSKPNKNNAPLAPEPRLEPKKVSVTRGNNLPDMLITQVDIRNIVRQSQDINKWRTAQRTAENVWFPKRTLLYDLYFDIILDSHLLSVINKRKTAISNINVRYINADGKINDNITKIIQKPWFRKMLKQLLDSKFWGHTLLEFEFSGDQIRTNLIPRKHVMPEKGYVLRYQADIEGLYYRDIPYTNFTLEAGDPKDLGLFIAAAPLVIYKRNNLADLAQFNELFGQPFRDAVYPDYNDDSRVKMEEAVTKSGGAPWIIRPSGTELTIIPNSSPGSKDMFESLDRICDEGLSKLVLGQTLTTQASDKGTHALGKVHWDVEAAIHEEDKIDILDILNNDFTQLLQIHGYPVQDCGRFEFEEPDLLELTDKILIFKTGKDEGVPITDDYFYETFSVDKPDNYDELKAQDKADKEARMKLLTSQGNDNEPPAPGKKKNNNLPEDKKIKTIVDFLKGFF